MTRIFFAVLLLSLSIAACEPGPTETNSNANGQALADSGGQPIAGDQPIRHTAIQSR